jgi:NhaA family Na+:H+ antiporter
MALADLGKPLTLGIILGLFVGKQVGIFGAIVLMHITKITTKPANVNWLHLYGMSLLCGIGFTMSLFIGTLAFPTKGDMTPVQLGIMSGSSLSAICGYIALRLASRRT